jgi:hypothetical protein
MNLILPVCGNSSRFPNMRPKWLLTHPLGNTMLTESIRGLDVKALNNILIVALQEHEDRYKFGDSLKQELKDVYDIEKVTLCLIEESKS